MGFDFSALDAELEALGTPSADALLLAERYAGAVRSTDQADAQLASLGEAVDVRAVAARLTLPRVESASRARAELPLELAIDELADDGPHDMPLAFAAASPVRLDARAPESGEMALPEPVRRPPDPSSGELTLDSEPPTSGSFALPENDVAAPEDELSPIFDSIRPASPRDEGSAPPLTPIFSEPPQLQVDTLSDDDEDPDTQAVFAALADLPEPAGSLGESRLKGLADLPAASIRRDPDAEFEAIFSDATSPSGIPTRGLGFEEESPSAEELLTGLEAPNDGPLADALAGPDEPNDDHTEVLDSRTLTSITANAKPDVNPFRPERDLDSSDFEIVMDDEVAEPVKAAPTPPPPTPMPPKRSPPPPLPQSGSQSLDKRPSFLGRLFGRKDQPNE